MPHQKNQGCAALLASLFGSKSKPVNQPATPVEPPPENPPYRLTQAFLTPAEISFYHVIKQAVGNQVVICAKVSLGDLFYPQTSDRAANQTWRNKIDRKHVDFLLCDPHSMRPLLGIELDDASHQQKARQERDSFIEQVFVTAGLPLYRQPVRASYHVQDLATALFTQLGMAEPALAEPPRNPVLTEVKPNIASISSDHPDRLADAVPTNETPACPTCQKPMVLRTVKKTGPQFGRQFWGCPDYPQCRGMRPYELVKVTPG